MTSRSLAYVIIGVLMIFSVAQHAWYWPQLPERTATHFGVDGQANDWMSRDAATLMMCGLQIGIPLFLVAVTFLAARLPDSMVNIPHREYWLQPERRAATLAWMHEMLAWIAVLTATFMIMVGHLTFIANVTGLGLNTRLFLISLGVYLAAVFSIAGRSLWRFRLPRTAA